MLKTLKQLFSIVKFEANLELVDGTIITVSNFEVGAEVFIVSPDGNLVLPDGEYELASGQTFIVVEGKISEIIEVTEDEEPIVTEEPIITEDPIEEEMLDESEVEIRIIAIEERLAELSTSIAALTERLNASNFSAENTELEEKVNSIYTKLEKIAGAEPVIVKVEKSEPISRREQIRNAILNK